jgi:hypothetical protein
MVDSSDFEQPAHPRAPHYARPQGALCGVSSESDISLVPGSGIIPQRSSSNKANMIVVYSPGNERICWVKRLSAATVGSFLPGSTRRSHLVDDLLPS